MNSTATLELRDIHLPDPVSWWPLAPGWWISLGLIILLLFTVILVRQFYRSRQLKRDIDNELQQIKSRYQQSHDEVALATELSVLLRRASISYFQYHGRDDKYRNVAGLTGERWLEWLDETRTDKTGDGFQSDIGRLLISAPYLPRSNAPDFDPHALIDLCERWLSASHHKQARAS